MMLSIDWQKSLLVFIPEVDVGPSFQTLGLPGKYCSLILLNIGPL